MIEFKDVHIGYDRHLLSVEPLQLERGKLYVLFGKNGIGKSTFFKTLTRQIPPLQGVISIEGRSIQQFGIKAIARHLSFTPVGFPVLDFVRVEEFVALGRLPYTNFTGILNEEDSVKVHQALQLLNIEHLSGQFTASISDGEKQMAAIARSIAQQTNYILLDEPTAFLDYKNKKRVLEVLHNIAKTFNKCIVISSHDIDLCLNYTHHYLIASETDRKIFYTLSEKKEFILNQSFRAW